MKTSSLIFDIGTPARVDLDAVLATAERCDPYFYSIALDGAAERSRTEGDATLADTLNLLSLAMQPMLDATSDDQPFRPILEVEGRRSILPQDFTTEHTRSFASTLGNIGDPELRARLADIVWLRRADLVDRREGVEATRSAVEAYLAAASVQEASGKFV